MSALQEVTLAALESQAFALMSRLHVILRRHNGRVTDIEYMRLDPAYCRYVLQLASGMDHEDLPQICTKLEQVFFGAEGLFVRIPPKAPLLSNLAAQREATAKSEEAVSMTAQLPAASIPAVSTATAGDAALDKAYIGRLR
ncbi:hypothetical protein [Noviherbaspirillum sp. Root189]|uniref:hypothetical protein n=1 Tax=Noviherbaspirillum sp. Root189 TaxID=1736487 RepID=UPI000709F255|nr:hypothetical protein [Noviherbaspirillum sp. Root189]KRB73579.1 hypothetical protein ASE07_06955 [Noviherbaspirillum sp. Root189]